MPLNRLTLFLYSLCLIGLRCATRATGIDASFWASGAAKEWDAGYHVLEVAFPSGQVPPHMDGST